MGPFTLRSDMRGGPCNVTQSTIQSLDSFPVPPQHFRSELVGFGAARMERVSEEVHVAGR